MSLSSGTTIIEWDAAGWTQLESSGASTSAGAVSAAATTECTPTQHLNAPLLEFAISAEFGANTPTAGTAVTLLAKINDIGAGSQDGNVPTTAFMEKVVGIAPLKASAGTQYLMILAPPPGQNFDLYLYNGDDTDAMTWKLWVRAKTVNTTA